MQVTVKKFITLVPDENMWLYDGETLSDKVFLPLDADTYVWKEISDAEATVIRQLIEALHNQEELDNVTQNDVSL